VEEFRGLAFKSMSHELQHPADRKKDERDNPEAVIEESGKEDEQRNQNRGNAVGMAKPVDRVLVATLVPRNPLLTAVRTQHGA